MPRIKPTEPEFNELEQTVTDLGQTLSLISLDQSGNSIESVAFKMLTYGGSGYEFAAVVNHSNGYYSVFGIRDNAAIHARTFDSNGQKIREYLSSQGSPV